MRQKTIRVCRNPEFGQGVTVTWGDGGEIDYPGITEAATALGCSQEWLEENLQTAFHANIGVSLLDLYWDDGTWWPDHIGRKFNEGDLISVLGEITIVHDDKGEVTVRIFGVADTVTLPSGNVELIEHRVSSKGPPPEG